MPRQYVSLGHVGLHVSKGVEAVAAMISYGSTHASLREWVWQTSPHRALVSIQSQYLLAWLQLRAVDISDNYIGGVLPDSWSSLTSVSTPWTFCNPVFACAVCYRVVQAFIFNIAYWSQTHIYTMLRRLIITCLLQCLAALRSIMNTFSSVVCLSQSFHPGYTGNQDQVAL